jgi:ATP synthase protein I
MSRPDPQRGSPELPRPGWHGTLAPQRPADPVPQSTAAPALRRPAAPAPSDQAWMLMVDLVVATLTWGGIGWLLDRWLGSGPWLMSLGFVVGNGAGIYLLWLRTNHAAAGEAAAGHRPRPEAAGPQRASGPDG